MSKKVLGIIFVGLLMVTAGTSPAQTPASCDRACLKTLLDQYIAAVIKHDPAAAPLVVGFRQTENAVNVKPGTGVWKTVTGLGKVQRRYLDPVSGQAAYYGTVDEGTTPAVVTIRVRIENKQLVEAEWYIARPDDPGLNGPRQPGRGPANAYNVDYLTQNPPPERVVPTAQRSDRATLERIVDSYFDAITSHDGSIALTHPGCGRVENGSPAPAGRFLPAANAAAGGAAGRGQAPAGGGNDCVGGMQNFNLSMVVARRTPLIDEEAQAVLAYAVFIRRPGSPTPRNTFSEWFFIDEAKIRTIYTAMFYPANDLAVPNWPPYTGNWPLPAPAAAAPATPAR